MAESLTWLTTSEVAGLVNLTERAVRLQIDAGQLKTQTQEQQGRGRGGRVHLVALESLPKEAQRRYLERFIEEGGFVDTPEDAALPADQRQTERISTVAELVAKYGQVRANEILAEASAKWEQAAQEALAIKAGREKGKTERTRELAAGHGISLATLYRVRDGYEKNGILGLVNERYLAQGEGLEGTMRRSIDDEAINWIKAICLVQPKPTTAHIYRELKKVGAKRGWRIPSKATVYRIIEEILPTEKTMGHEGEKEWDAKMMPKIKRDYSHLLAMEEIVGDGHTFDFFVDWYGRAIRPVLSAWEDMRTRKIVGWCISLTSNSDTIALALRHAIITNGLPSRIYTDNGKDYKSLYIADVCRRLKIETRHCIPKTPRSKMIERLFRTVHDQFSLYQPGYCGNKPENRPPSFDEKKLLRQGKLPKIEALVAAWEAYVEIYNNQPHRGIKDAPAKLFAEIPHANPGQVNVRDLDILLMRREGVTVQHQCIQFMGRDFWSDDIDLGRLVGEKVQVWYDANRIGEVVIYYRGKIIGTATNKKALLHGESRAELAAEIQAARNVRRAVKMQIASYAEGLEDILPEEVVKKAKRTKRYFSPEKAPEPPGSVSRLTGQEHITREARRVLDQAQSVADEDKPESKRKYTRAEKMLLARGDRILTQ